VKGEDEWWQRGLVEVEVGSEVAELGCDLANVGTRVGSSVGAWVEPLPIQEVVLDELDDRVKAQRRVSTNLPRALRGKRG
jgi:hypothetical protein